MKAIILCAVGFCLAAVFVGETWAGQPRTHDGFFLRLSAGGGFASTSEDVGFSEFEISGASGDVNIAIGGMVSPNLALHGTLFGWSTADPDVKLTGFGSGELDGDVTMAAFGAGLTYYFTPSNVYISGSAGAGSLELDLSGGPSVETDTGLALDFTLGKEWWVGNSWGLGLAGVVGYHSIPDVDESLSGVNLGLRFSATLN